MTSSSCETVGILLAETSPSFRAARLRSSSLELDFPGAAAELRLSNIAVGSISIRRSVSSASSRSWAASRPSRAHRPGTEAGALSLDWTAPRRARRTARCSRRRSSSRSSIVYDYGCVARSTFPHLRSVCAPPRAHSAHRCKRAVASLNAARAALEATAPRTSQARSSVSGASGWPPHSAVNQRRVVGW